MYFSVHIKRTFLAVCAAAAVLGAVCIAYYRAPTASAAGQAEKSAESVKLPVIMYHSMLKEQKRLGKYVISPETFESDLQYLKQKGYQTVTVRDLADYVNSEKILPPKPVLLTFDDGYYNNYLYAFPLAKKYGMKFVVAPVGYYIDSVPQEDMDHANYSYLTWPEIKEMMASGLVEFQNHSYNLHETKGRIGAKKKRGETTKAYAAILQKDVRKMQDRMKEMTGYTPIAFIYPFGAVSKESDPIIRQMDFQATFLCTEKINVITHDPACLYSLGRFLRPSGISSAAYFEKMGL